MGRSWLINSRGLAQKVRNANSPDCGATRECPTCLHIIDNSDVYPEWPGFPAGVKFDPSDVELLEHLAAKSGEGNSKPHIFLDEFIPTLEVDEGICYTHPENLPGVRKDGSSVHFFYRTKMAYASGTRKRRRISSNGEGLMIEHVRWHKTGKTKAVMENGVQKGCKKVMVLYRSAKKGEKPCKTNWIMHQYHLGTDEDEKEGGFVVSKIYYQQQKLPTDNNGESDMCATQAIPSTPMMFIPNPPRAGETTPSCDDIFDHSLASSPAEEVEVANKGTYVPSSDDVQVKCEEYPACLAGESQADATDMDDFLLCDEIAGSYEFGNLQYDHHHHGHSASFSIPINHMPQGDGNAPGSIDDLVNLELDTPPEFSLQDLPMGGSQDSLSSWLERF